ncbi:MAG: hypothetical protein ACQESK_05005 [Bacteroidota bacterium]
MNKLVLLFGLVVLTIGCNTSNHSKTADLVEFVPHETAFFLQSNSLQELTNAATENHLIAQNLSLPAIDELLQQLAYLENLNTDQETFLCFTKIGKKDYYSTVITDAENAFSIDSTALSDKKSLTYDGHQIDEYFWKEKSIYTTQIASKQITSESKIILENIIRDRNSNRKRSPSFHKMIKSASSSSPSIFFNLKEFTPVLEDFFDRQFFKIRQFSDWATLDLKLGENQLQLNGITLPKKDEKRILHILSNQKQSTTNIGEIIPMNALSFEVFPISDWGEVQLKRNDFTVLEWEETAMFETIDEIGKISLENGHLITLHSTNSGETERELANISKSEKSYRSYEIFRLDKTLLFNNLRPFFDVTPPSFYVKIDGYFIFSYYIEHLENLIINYQNQAVINQRSFYQKTLEELSKKSSYLAIGFTENIKKKQKAGTTAQLRKNFADIELKNFPLIAMQLNAKDDYAHLNLVAPLYTPNEADKNQVTQLNRIKHENDIIVGPYFFTNWRTQQKDIAFQDIKNKLFLYDTKGNKIWEKQLDAPIVGDIQEIDIYRNTRIQLVFTTENKLYLLDKDANEVDPFPIEFSKKITQGLSIFDYDKNGKYRFVITQGNNLKMFNKEGKAVKGFDFDLAKNDISFSPKHFRIANRDYIIVSEENKQHHILSRTGEKRIEYKTDFNFSDNECYLRNQEFVTTNKNGDLVQINEKGKVETLSKNYLDNHKIAANKDFIAVISENKLHLNEKENKLDYGVYTTPKLIQLNNKTYISITDLQAEKVYLFNDLGKLINGFPVFGKSEIQLHKSGGEKFIFSVKGDKNAILIYSF